MNTVAIDNNVIDRMLSDLRFLQHFSFLRTAKLIIDGRRTAQRTQRKKGCKKCTNEAAITRSIYTSVKKSISKITPSQQALLCQLLGVDGAKVSYRIGSDIKVVEF